MVRSHLPALFCLAALPCLALSEAQAAASAWHEATGARIRLVVEDAPLADGSWRGALEVDLQPGWKTYWRDPGDAGIPPQVDVSASMNIAGAELGYPAPVRLGGEDGGWAGYDRPMAFPIVFRVEDPSRFAAIEADVLIGVCEDICVPVMVRLTPPPSAGSDVLSARVVDAAFASLPGAASPGFGLKDMARRGDDIFVAAEGADATAGLFLVSPPGWVLGMPRAAMEGDVPGFLIPVAEAPGDMALPDAIDYTLVTSNAAVSGVVRPVN